MRRFKVVCDSCEGTGKDGSCDWCNGAGYKIITSKSDRVPLGAFEEIPLGNEKAMNDDEFTTIEIKLKKKDVHKVVKFLNEL